MSSLLQETVAHAAAAWRRARARQATVAGARLALLGFGVSVLWVYIAGPGVTPRGLVWGLLWLLLPIGLGGARWLRGRPGSAEAATAVDRRAILDDRLATALEFEHRASNIARLQRADAEAACRDLDPRGLFPGPGHQELGRLVVAAVLALGTAGAALSWDLGPRDHLADLALSGPRDDLLATIDRDRSLLLDRGDKDRAQLLTDLEARILKIQAREQQLRRIVQQRRTIETEQAADEPEPTEAQTRTEPGDEPPRDDGLITTADLATLEAEAMRRLVLADAHEAEVVADLFRQTRVARKLTRHFDRIAEREMELGHHARATSDPGTRYTSEDETNDAVQTMDGGQNATEISDRSDEANDLSRRELDGESMAEHDRAHDYQESFNEFLRDFVKDVRDLLEEASGGEKRKKKGDGDRDVAMGGGDGVADKRDAREEAGFEEMGEVKRAPAPETGEPLGDEAALAIEPGDEALGQGTAATAAMQASGGGDTSPGGQGAGRGDEAGDGLQAMLDAYIQPGAGPLERVLGQLAQGRLPEERRELLYERLARHKVSSSAASEADDVLVDYFADAEAMLSARDADLPPLFRDFAHRYFDAIRPQAQLEDEEVRDSPPEVRQ